MWIQSKIPEMEVKNLVGDWKDGRALAALVNAISRDFKLDEPFDDPEALSPFEAEATLEKAMAHADKNLGVGRLVTPEQVSLAALCASCTSRQWISPCCG